MSASFSIYKYIGKDGIFGNPVSSIGLKREDRVVPAVYGNPIMPGDDASDSNSYAVYKPEDEHCQSFSFESIFKLKLSTNPSNQLSNVRIWSSRNEEFKQGDAVIYIGNSTCFSRPTNTQSLVAKYPLHEYTKENPFYLTVNGNSGQHVSKRVASQQFQLTVKDVGFGNIFFIDGIQSILYFYCFEFLPKMI